MTILADRVRLVWCGLNGPEEGVKDFLYLDTHVPPIPTTAIGCVVMGLGAMRGLAWLTADGQPATVAQIDAEWRRVTAMTGGLRAERYEDTAHGLHLPPEEIDRLVLERLDQDAAILTARWPGLPGWPPAAQAATLALSWAVGAGAAASGLTGPSWPHLHAALDGEDWKGAAQAGQLSWVHNPGVRPRDYVVGALFLEAAGVAPDVARAFPLGSSADVARQALAAWDAAG